MTYNEFFNYWQNNVLPNKHKDERNGQSLMNYLGDVWPKEYIRLTSVHYYDETDIDCYYNDKLIDNTLNHLSKIWYNFPN